ncbi:hypothetical protein MATL_G00000980 [Megalops atlanticus]|uniref:Kinesin motor domain-containing protein n=1 Tax=Megalops atlanticus TaxID=7932 RepID=A0A9D3TKL8_MEGAT|nr:hypothetical protein MATL_G00000980 [Megalops atlanticus]
MKDTGESKDHQLTVALRIRPLSDAELEESATIVAHRVDDQVFSLLPQGTANESKSGGLGGAVSGERGRA